MKQERHQPVVRTHFSNTLALVIPFCLSAFGLGLLGCQVKPTERVGRLGGLFGAHQIAAKIKTPQYPPSSLAERREGLVVAEVKVDDQGNLRQLRIIEAPDNAMRAAVELAVKKWRFNSLGKPGISALGKLFFYFRITQHGGIVETPPDLRPVEWAKQRARTRNVQPD